MAEPVLLLGVGAAKAGTSWLYRALDLHPQAHVRAIKEAHYWDSAAPEAVAKCLEGLERYGEGLKIRAIKAEIGAKLWQMRNIERQRKEVASLIKVIGGDRAGHRAYLDWLTEGAGDARVVGELTPAYGLLPVETLREMAGLTPNVHFVFSMRDPLARLWSHVRMQATRQKLEDEDLAEKAHSILWRILNKGRETHLTERGDYSGPISRLRDVVPEDRLHLVFFESLLTEAGFAGLCDRLGLDRHRVDVTEPVHEGPRLAFPEDLREQALDFLQDQYEWVGRNVGPLPQAWQDNLARTTA